MNRNKSRPSRQKSSVLQSSKNNTKRLQRQYRINKQQSASNLSKINKLKQVILKRKYYDIQVNIRKQQLINQYILMDYTNQPQIKQKHEYLCLFGKTSCLKDYYSLQNIKRLITGAISQRVKIDNFSTRNIYYYHRFQFFDKQHRKSAKHSIKKLEIEGNQDKLDQVEEKFEQKSLLYEILQELDLQRSYPQGIFVGGDVNCFQLDFCQFIDRQTPKQQQDHTLKVSTQVTLEGHLRSQEIYGLEQLKKKVKLNYLTKSNNIVPKQVFKSNSIIKRNSLCAKYSNRKSILSQKKGQHSEVNTSKPKQRSFTNNRHKTKKVAPEKTLSIEKHSKFKGSQCKKSRIQ